MLLSIICPTFNASSIIKPLLRSINQQFLGQYLSQVELVVKDSSNSSDNIIHCLSDLHINYQYINSMDNGIYNAFNQGVQIASGEWVLFLGADDSFPRSNSIHAILELCNEAAYTYLDLFFIPYITRSKNYSKEFHPTQLSLLSFVPGMPFSHQSIISRKHTLARAPFNCRYKYAGDYHWLLLLFRNNITYGFFSASPPLVTMSLEGRSSTLKLRDTICLEQINALISVYKNPFLALRLVLSLVKTYLTKLLMFLLNYPV